MNPRRGDVFLISLEPTVGHEMRKTRPCVIVSPDELNEHLDTHIVAPMTTGGRAYPFRVSCRFGGRAGFIVLDQLRTVDRKRLIGRLGRVSRATLAKTVSTLREMFEPDGHIHGRPP